MNLFNTADICDETDDMQIVDPIFKAYGNNKKFSGKIRTVIAIEDNSYVKKLVDSLKLHKIVQVICWNVYVHTYVSIKDKLFM